MYGHPICAAKSTIAYTSCIVVISNAILDKDTLNESFSLIYRKCFSSTIIHLCKYMTFAVTKIKMCTDMMKTAMVLLDFCPW